MRPFAIALSCALVCMSAAARSAGPGQARPAAAAGDSAVGAVLFRLRCADCHGIDAKGVLGPDLTTLWAAGRSDETVYRTIREGVPGTEMPSSSAPDPEIKALVAYLRSLNSDGASNAGAARTEAVPSDPEHGARLFDTHCAGCHRIDGRGGRLGPDLSRVGVQRSRTALARKIRMPASAAVGPGYQPVTLVMLDGRRVRGTRKNEDAFSIQIMDLREQLVAYSKSGLKEVLAEPPSLMPAFSSDRLRDGDLNDLLAYLETRRRPLLGR